MRAFMCGDAGGVPDVERLAEFDWVGYTLQHATGLANVIWVVVCDLNQAPPDSTVRDLGDPTADAWTSVPVGANFAAWIRAAYPDHQFSLDGRDLTRSDFLAMSHDGDFRATLPDGSPVWIEG